MHDARHRLVDNEKKRESLSTNSKNRQIGFYIGFHYNVYQTLDPIPPPYLLAVAFSA